MKNNKSVKTFQTDWVNLNEEQIEKWLGTGHVAVLASYYGFVGSSLVVACEKGDLKVLKFIVDNHDVNSKGMTVKELLNMKGLDTDGDEQYPLSVAANPDVKQYLLDNGADEYLTKAFAKELKEQYKKAIYNVNVFLFFFIINCCNSIFLNVSLKYF